MKINYMRQTPKSCGTCKKRIRSALFELFCHADKGPLDTRHVVSELGICSEYDGDGIYGYSATDQSIEENAYYTPGEYYEAFQKYWGDMDAVYYLDYTDTNEGEADQRFWRLGTLGELKQLMEDVDNGEVLCATTHRPAGDYVHKNSKHKEGENDGD
jgi:hypothetical protein